MESYADEPVEVEVVQLWDGRSEASGEVAQLRILYPEFESFEFSEEILSSWLVRFAVQQQLEEFVRRHLGQFSISVEDVEIRRGSITIIGVLVAAAVVVKDYPKFREGAIQLAKDLRAASGLILATLRRAASKEKSEEERKREATKKTQVQRSSSSSE